MLLRLKVSVACEALHHFSLHFIREFLPRKSHVALDLPRGLAFVCMLNGSEYPAHEIPASGDAEG